MLFGRVSSSQAAVMARTLTQQLPIARLLRTPVRPLSAFFSTRPPSMLDVYNADGVVLAVNADGSLRIVNVLNSDTTSALEKSVRCDETMTKEAKAGAVHLVFGVDKAPKIVALVSLGKTDAEADKKLTPTEKVARNAELTRIVSGAGVKALRRLGAKSILVDAALDDQAATEGAHLAVYSYDELKKKKNGQKEGQSSADEVELSMLSADATLVKRGTVFAHAQNVARRLAETPSNLLTPTKFVEHPYVQQLKNQPGVEVIIHDEEWAAKRNMGCFLAVGQGSAEKSVFLEVKYTPSSAEDAARKPIVLVGKGVTFDSGGISIKPSGGMGMMKGDMGGAAAVLGAVSGIASLQPTVPVVALIPLVENMPSRDAYKPGDVIRASNGITVEVDNTDAEGRLILADALVYAGEFKPSHVVDVATLTGAMDVALGGVYTGVFASEDEIWNSLDQAGNLTGEKVWRMPLDSRYKSQIDSTVADLNNCGDRSAGACTAAIFLKEFVDFKNVDRYAHVDIAGTMHSKKGGPYSPPNAMTGTAARTLLQFVELVSKTE
eukprot:TRINITY_DN2824_c0_g1_i1.p1 TRINITY_DN2824_c0_g1~~TRINITY_DN2824_c0_g1_i1.p1  ORF type:complete len:576 (+),score=130.96 TRINITY_DN2824_c0_g1_i1:80-1729(+)